VPADGQKQWGATGSEWVLPMPMRGSSSVQLFVQPQQGLKAVLH